VAKVLKGLKAEEWMIAILRYANVEVQKASKIEDRKYKVDFWVKLTWPSIKIRRNWWVGIQLSVNYYDFFREGERESALWYGTIPFFVNFKDLDIAFNCGYQQMRGKIVRDFISKVEETLGRFPYLALRKPIAEYLRKGFISYRQREK